MSAFGTRLRYGSVAQFFHWLTVVLVIAAYLLGEGGPESRVYGPDNASALSWHETLGILVLVVVAIRLIWRLFDRAPEEPPMAAWMSLLSRVVHWLLYAFLIALPLTAILGTSLKGHPTTLLGIGPIGPITGSSPATGEALLEIHEFLGNWIIWLAGLHAAAALFHHFFLKDRVLLAMLPWTRS
jgi:cytochrome b561